MLPRGGGALFTQVVAVLPLSPGEALVPLPHDLQDLVGGELLALLGGEGTRQRSPREQQRRGYRGRRESQELATSERDATGSLRRRVLHEVLSGGRGGHHCRPAVAKAHDRGSTVRGFAVVVVDRVLRTEDLAQPVIASLAGDEEDL